MEEVNKNTELDNTDKKLHISDVITRSIHDFVTELVINEKIDVNCLKCGYNERYGQITVTETKPNMVRTFYKPFYYEL